MGLALLSAILLSGFYFAGKSGNNPDVYNNDFNVYYHAAREIIAGNDPYAHSLGDWTPYIYPPLLAELLVPLAVLPLPVAAYLWYLINAASIVLAAWCAVSLLTANGSGAAQTINPSSALWKEAVAAGAVILVLRFVLDTLSLGQVNALVAALVVAHLYLYFRGHRTLSAIILALAISIKLIPALLLAYHIAKLRWRHVIACAGVLIVLTAVSLLPFGKRGTDVLQVFVRRTISNQQGYDFSFSGNQSIRGAIGRFQSSKDNAINADARSAINWATVASAIALLIIAAFVAAKSRNEMASAASFFCLMVLLSPLSWKAHFVILIPAAARLVCETRRMFAALICAAVFILFNFTSTRVLGVSAAEWADEHSLVLVGALLLFLACVVLNVVVRKNKPESVAAYPTLNDSAA